MFLLGLVVLVMLLLLVITVDAVVPTGECALLLST
jgi:hypothetical protein